MLLLVAGSVLNGCQSAPRAGAGAIPADGTSVNAPINGAQAAEAITKRAEALARFATGWSYVYREEPDKALPEFYSSALADPTNEGLVIEVSRRLIQQKQHAKAIEILTKATAWPTASGTLFSLLGLAYSQAGKTELAIAANRTAIQKLPQAISAYQNLTQLYLKTGNAAEALLMLETAAKPSDLDVPFLVDLAELMSIYLRAQTADAGKVKLRVAALLDRVAQLKPTDPATRQRMADGYVLAGQTARAAELYLGLLAQFQDEPNVREIDRELGPRLRQRLQCQLRLLLRDLQAGQVVIDLLQGRVQL